MGSNPSFTDQQEQYKQLLKQQEDLGIDQIFTNLDLNSSYKTYLSIAMQVHWFNQLRICEQIIIAKTSVLKNYFSETDKFKGNKNDPVLIAQMRDALQELKIAIDMKNCIVSEHPEIKTLSSERLQEIYGKEAHLAEVTHNFAVKILSEQTGVSESLLDYATRLPESDKGTFLQVLETRVEIHRNQLSPQYQPEQIQQHDSKPSDSARLMGLSDEEQVEVFRQMFESSELTPTPSVADSEILSELLCSLKEEVNVTDNH